MEQIGLNRFVLLLHRGLLAGVAACSVPCCCPLPTGLCTGFMLIGDHIYDLLVLVPGNVCASLMGSHDCIVPSEAGVWLTGELPGNGEKNDSKSSRGT